MPPSNGGEVYLKEYIFLSIQYEAVYRKILRASKSCQSILKAPYNLDSHKAASPPKDP